MENNKKETLERLFIWLTLITVAVLLFSSIYHIAFVIDDDFDHYLYAQRRKIYLSALAGASEQGRISNLFLSYMACLPFSANSLLVYKLISYGSIIFAVWTMYFLLSRHVDRKMGIIAAILFFGLAQVDAQHNLFIAYVFSHQMSIGFVLLSAERQITYYKKHNKWCMVASGALLMLSAIFYEAFFMFCVMSFVISMFASFINEKKSLIKRIGSSLWELRFHIIFVALYLVVYLIFRMNSDISYDGNSFGSFNLLEIGYAILNYAFGLVPFENFRSYVKNEGFAQYIIYVKPAYVIVAIMAAVAVYLLVRKVKKLNRNQYIGLFMISIMVILFSTVIVGSTGKYREWAIAYDVRAYVPSYYSYFGIIMLIVTVAILCYQKISNRIVHAVVMTLISACVLLGCITSSTSNNKFKMDYANGNLAKQITFDSVVSSDYFLEQVPNEATVYIEGEISLQGSPSNLNHITAVYTEKSYNFVDTKAEVDFAERTYGLYYDPVTLTARFGILNQDYTLKNEKVYEQFSNGKMSHFVGHAQAQ